MRLAKGVYPDCIGQPRQSSVVAPALNGKRPVGRPSIRTEENAIKILSLVMRGKSMREIEEATGISDTAFWDWHGADAEFASNYARAKEIFAEREFHDIISLSDKANAENANAIRLQVDTRKWVLSKLLPKRFGDKPADVNVTNNNVVNVITTDRQKELQDRMQRALQR